MYIMCVCLFSALSRRVGALQISIIIIIIIIIRDTKRVAKATAAYSRQRYQVINLGFQLTHIIYYM